MLPRRNREVRVPLCPFCGSILDGFNVDVHDMSGCSMIVRCPSCGTKRCNDDAFLRLWNKGMKKEPVALLPVEGSVPRHSLYY